MTPLCGDLPGRTAKLPGAACRLTGPPAALCPLLVPVSGPVSSSGPGGVQKTSGNAERSVPAPRTTYRRHDAQAALINVRHGWQRQGVRRPDGRRRAGINMLASIVDVSHFRGLIRPMPRAATYFRRPADRTDWDPSQDLRQAVEGRGGIVVATYSDDDGSPVRARNAGWKALLTNLDAIDQVVVASAADLPGRNVKGLLHLLDVLRGHGVSLCLCQERINTGSATASDLLDVASAWQRAKLSKAIKIGQARAVEAGKTIGRPAIPHSVVVGIRRSLAAGGGIRWTARRFMVSPGTVINIRRTMPIRSGVEAVIAPSGHQAMHILLIIVY